VAGNNWIKLGWIFDGVRTLVTENRMISKGPTLAKPARMGHPNSKSKPNFKDKEGQARLLGEGRDA
jgi:hypothetical protein